MRKKLDAMLGRHFATAAALAVLGFCFSGAGASAAAALPWNSQNFTKCRGFYGGLGYPAADETCNERIKNFSFIANPNFDKCHELYHETLDSIGAAEVCIDRTGRFKFINNPNFDACYAGRRSSLDSMSAADLCIESSLRHD